MNRLFAHLRWADQAVLDAFRAAATPPARALEIYAHILGAEHLWLARLHQRQPRHPVWPSLTLAACATLAAENAAAFDAYLATMTPGRLTDEVPYTNSAGRRFRSRVDDILTHVALHGCYHRGQVALLMRGAGADPAPTDYIGFIRGVPAATTPTAASRP